MARIDIKDCTVTFKDGTSPTPNSVSVKVGDGTLTYTEARNMEYLLDRGLLDTVREGDQIPLAVSLDLVWEFLKSSTTSQVTPEEALKREGGAADWQSSSDDQCEPYAVDVVIDHDPSCTTEELEQITLPDYRWENIDHDLRAATLKTAGNCNVTRATILRLAQTT